MENMGTANVVRSTGQVHTQHLRRRHRTDNGGQYEWEPAVPGPLCMCVPNNSESTCAAQIQPMHIEAAGHCKHVYGCTCV